MSTIVSSTIENSTTNAAAWKKVFAGVSAPVRSAASIHNYTSNNAPIWVAIVPHGAAAPANPANSTDESTVAYIVYAGDTQDLGSYGDKNSDVYVCDPNLTGGFKYRAWELVN
jgi:hypothetical protein